MHACDFFLTITANFRTLYVFVLLEVGTRRIVHRNVTEHPTADWTVYPELRQIGEFARESASDHSEVIAYFSQFRYTASQCFWIALRRVAAPGC